jgi:hypothetical protein
VAATSIRDIADIAGVSPGHRMGRPARGGVEPRHRPHERGIERHLEASFADPAQLERWNRATNALFQEGLYRRP